MDTESFDRLVRLFGTSGTRRAAMGVLIGSALAGISLGSEAARNRGKVHRRGRGKGSQSKGGNGKTKRRENRARAESVPARCFTGTNCAPGPGKNLAKCNFGGASLIGAKLKGANLGQANLAGADATNANLGGANLGGACLVDADLSGANLAGVNTGQAIFCRTTMPDSESINNSGCNSGTTCCPTCIDLGEPCGGDLGGACCGAHVCTGGPGTPGICCPQGQNNCDGACVDLLRDPINCTACGNECPTPLELGLENAVILCGPGFDENGDSGHGCAILCTRGFGNCSGDPLADCETRINDDPNNCGSCGFKCPSDRPFCCGCLCFADHTECSTCPPSSRARLIRR
jgi:hypothetical protein